MAFGDLTGLNADGHRDVVGFAADTLAAGVLVVVIDDFVEQGLIEAVALGHGRERDALSGTLLAELATGFEWVHAGLFVITGARLQSRVTE